MIDLPEYIYPIVANADVPRFAVEFGALDAVGTGVTIEPNHRGKNKTDYRHSLSPKTIELIQNKFGDYLVDLGYVI
jgi:hypothetical protein